MDREGDLSTLIRAPTGELPEGLTLRLSVVQSPDGRLVGQAVPLPALGQVLTVGRDVAGGYLVRDPHLSRVHLRIALDVGAQAYRLGDAGSANGTWVNGESVTTHVLEPGDVVRIGDTLLVAEDEQAQQDFEDLVRRMGASSLPVLILGETGAGKEVTARRLHEISRRSGRFVAVNCAAFTAELLGSELFGHVRGAFSGAARDRQGLFSSANNGTLFLDEVGDLPTDLQPTLLRVLEDGQVRPIGSDRSHGVDVRVLAATNREVDREASQPSLRRDLQARLAQLVLRVAPLRERRGRVLDLARLFAREQGMDLALSTDAAEDLLLYDFPENVRELQAIIRTFVVVSGGRGELGREYLAKHRPDVLGVRNPSVLPGAASGERDRRAELKMLLQEHEGNVSAVAQVLGKPRAQIYRWMRSLGLRPEDFR